MLLEDLLEQEKREQQKQLPPHAPGLMGAAPEEPLLSDFDFERLKADVLSSSNLPVSLSPPNMVGNAMPTQQPGVFIRSATGQLSQMQGVAPPQHWQIESGPNGQQIVSQQQHQPPPPVLQPGPSTPGGMDVQHGPLGGGTPGTQGNQMRMNLTLLPPPPLPPEHITSEQDRQIQIQYEQWLFQQQQQLAMNLKAVETEVAKLRKQKKTINGKLRQLKKTNSQLSEQDNMELERITRELNGLQKQLDHVRKQNRQHGNTTQEYRNKQQKKQQQQQQMMGGNPQNNLGAQMSPLGPSSANSPLHSSTPQSPMHMSSSPGMQGGPSPSPLMQHSPMASPLTPSPGPHSAQLSQTSPRVIVNPGQHSGTMDDMPFSPSNDPNMRPMMSGQMPQNIRLPVGGQVQMRMSSPNVGSPGSHQQIIVQQQPGGPNQVGNQPGIMIVRGINPNMIPMQHQQQMGRMRAVMGPGQAEQMKMLAGHMSSPQRFQRVGISQEVLARVKGPQQFPNSMSGMPMSPVGAPQQHYVSSARVPFPSQSPNSATNINMNMRSPSPMTPVGGLGSPPTSNQSAVMQMVQNRVSPASSPMRRPSGSSSIGAPSPMMADRPQSVENPMTPRSTAGGSRPHTPIGSNVVLQQQQQQHGHLESMNLVPTSHAPPTSMDSGQFSLDAYTSCAPPITPTHGEYVVTSAASGGGGGGGQNHQILPFPTFSWSDGVHKMGLKGGSPFSVINESVQASNNNNTTASNSVSDSEVATQATTITVNTTSTELNNESSNHGVVDGESSSNAINPSSSVQSSTGPASLSTIASNSTDHVSVTAAAARQSESVPVKSVLVPPSISNTSATSANTLSPVKTVSNSSSAASVLPTTTTTCATVSMNTTKVDGVAAAHFNTSNSLHPVTNTSAPANIAVTSTAVPTTSQESLLTKISVKTAVAAVVSSPAPLSNSVKESPPPPPPVVVVSSVQAMVNSIAKVVNAASSVPSTSPAMVALATAVNSHSGNMTSTIKTHPVSTSSAFVVATTAQVMSLPTSAGLINVPQSVSTQQHAVRPNVTSVSLRPPLATFTLSSVMSPGQGGQVTAIKSVPLSMANQKVQPPPPTVHMSLGGPLPPQIIQQVSVATPIHPPQQHRQQHHPLTSVMSSAGVSGVSSTMTQSLTNVMRQPLMGASTSSSTVASAVTFVPPTVTVPPPGTATSLIPPTSMPPASYTSVVPSASVTLVPSSVKPQPTPVAVGYTSVPFSNFPGAQQVHMPSSTHGQPPTSATVIYTTQHVNAPMGVRVSGPGNHPSSIQIPHQIPMQIQQQQGGTIVHHTVPMMTATHAGGGAVFINDTGAGSALGSINAMSNVAIPAGISVPSSNSATSLQVVNQQQSQGESQSQNALLKQLLQNTGCASMTQASENVGFSLTSCLSSRPSHHTSHLSEAATRIPQPTPILRPTTPTTPVQSVPAQIPLTRPTIKAEPMLTDGKLNGIKTIMCICSKYLII